MNRDPRRSTAAPPSTTSRPAWALLLGLLLATPLLVGCLDSDEAIERFSLGQRIDPYPGGFTFPPPVAYDGNGTLLGNHPLLDQPGRQPRYVEQLVPGGGAEPNIGVTSTGSIFVTTFDQVQRSQDVGRTWEIVHDFTPPARPVTQDVFTTADPMLWVDPDTDRVFANHMHPALLCTYLAWSDGEGEAGTWTERPLACGTPQVDHQKLVTAPPGPGAPAALTLEPAYPNVLYLCVNKLELGTWCSVSLDGGASFAYDRQIIPSTTDCPSINGHPAAFPDGTLAVPLGQLGGECQRRLTVVVTQDNGLTWSVRQCDPDLRHVGIDPDITVTPDGTAYMLFRAPDHRIRLLRTEDAFQSCEVFDVAPPDHTLDVFTAITSGDDGRIAMAYLGTRDEQYRGAAPSNATGGTRWHLFVTTSIDAGTPDPTFVTTQVTPEEDPIQVGCVWLLGGGGGPQGCRNLLDFIDATRDEQGRVYVAVTDGCIPRNGCAGEPGLHGPQSRGRQVGVAIQEGGPSLLADRGTIQPVGLVHPEPEPR